jgi:hypothetical protein
MLTKKEFTDAMNAIVAQIAEDKRISDALNAVINMNYSGKCYFDTKHALPGLIKMLVSTMKDNFDWIEYWLYDLECGRKWYAKCVTDADGKPIKLKTISDLYALLKKEYKNKK